MLTYCVAGEFRWHFVPKSRLGDLTVGYLMLLLDKTKRDVIYSVV